MKLFIQILRLQRWGLGIVKAFFSHFIMDAIIYPRWDENWPIFDNTVPVVYVINR